MYASVCACRRVMGKTWGINPKIAIWTFMAVLLPHKYRMHKRYTVVIAQYSVFTHSVNTRHRISDSITYCI